MGELMEKLKKAVLEGGLAREVAEEVVRSGLDVLKAIYDEAVRGFSRLESWRTMKGGFRLEAQEKGA